MRIHPRRRRLTALHGSRAQGWVPITEIHTRKAEGMTTSERIDIDIISAYTPACGVNAVSSAFNHSKASDLNDHRDRCWDEEGCHDRCREGNGCCIMQGAEARQHGHLAQGKAGVGGVRIRGHDGAVSDHAPAGG